ncbi:MAG: ABC-F family ATP-binding cassette domain-containing protein [Micromonosporaceae bacterium]|nr:ABC-F family ATP-binding cassette domain-containing protein [Micromonosporaceae bacterium]
MSDAHIVCSELSFSWPDDTPVFRGLSFSVAEGRTGLVAPNGAGKTTLLRLIAGDLRPQQGTISVPGVVGYLPQHLPLRGDLSVAEVLGIAPLVEALRAIESGDASEENFAILGNEWDIEERTRAELDRLGLGEVPLGRHLYTLSGGQVIALGLAAQLLKRPDVLLLDEPTNNLDLDARRRLYRVLDEWSGCLLVVSHDRALLSGMDRIAELHPGHKHCGEIRFYGGNFTAYEEAVRAAQEAAQREVRSAELEVKREKREMQQARERAERRSSNAARNAKSAGLPKIVAGALQRHAQESAGKAKATHAARIDQARARLDEAERLLRDDDRIVVELPATRVPAGRTVFTADGMQIQYGDRRLFAGSGVDLTVRGPERIALLGANGAGKSSLLRLVHSGAGGRSAYLSQRLDLLDPERSVAENLTRFAPAMPTAQRMHLLARLKFRGPRIHLPVRVLSGGERLRATLACVLYAEPAPQLLLLDEPTNNLDLVSIGQLTSALTAYQGAFIVVSHDERFLAEIGVNRWLLLAGGRLVETG